MNNPVNEHTSPCENSCTSHAFTASTATPSKTNDTTGKSHATIEQDGDLGKTLRKVTVKAGSMEGRMFEGPRREELEGLLRNGTLNPIDIADVPEGARVFGSRFVD